MRAHALLSPLRGPALLSLALAACGGDAKDSAAAAAADTSAASDDGAAEDGAADGADGSTDDGADGADDGAADGADGTDGTDGATDGGEGAADGGEGADGADGGDDGGAALACAPGGDRVSAAEADGVWSASLHTEDDAAWTCLSLTDGAQRTAAYTMAWQQWTVALGAGVEAQVLPDTAFDAVSAAPTDGWNSDADAVFGDWYIYDGATHTLTARPHLFLLRGPDGAAFKLQILSYYDAEGTVHRPQLRWAALVGG